MLHADFGHTARVAEVTSGLEMSVVHAGRTDRASLQLRNCFEFIV